MELACRFGRPFPKTQYQGFLELLDNVFASGEAFAGKDVKIVLQRSAGGPAETRYLDFVYQPIKDQAGNVAAIFVEGVTCDITDRHVSEMLRCAIPRPVCAN